MTAATAIPAPAPVAAADSPDLAVLKTPLADPVAGAYRTTIGWTVSWSCASIESACLDATITDTLPAGATIKAVTTAGGLVKSAVVTGNSVTWSLESPGTPGELDAGSVGALTITASVSCDAAGDRIFSNTASMAASNAVEVFSEPSPVTVTAAASCEPPPPPPPSKRSPARLNAGGRLPFFLTLPYQASAYELIDPTPPGLLFMRVSVSAPATVTVSCDDGATFQTVAFASPGPVGNCTKTGGYWNVTHSKFAVPSQSDPGWGEEQTSVSATINTRVPAGTPAGTTYTNTTGIGGPVTDPLTATGTVVPIGPVPTLAKSRVITPGEPRPDGFADDTHPVDDGDLGYSVTFGNHGNFGTAAAPLIDPTITDLLDPNVSFVDGENWWRIASIANEANLVGTGCRTPTFEKIENWSGTGRTLVRWKFANCTFPVTDDDPLITMYFTLRLRGGLAPGTVVANRADILGNNGTPQSSVCDAGTYLDAQDLDGDGDVSESICSENSGDSWTVLKLATIAATKWVNGAADPAGQYSRFPAVAKTTVDADGYATYQMYLDMRGNVTADRIELVDILPYVGDTATLNARTARKSGWSEELVGPITIETIDRTIADPNLSPKDQPAGAWAPVTSGVTIKYSASTNPCRLTANTFGRLHIDGMSFPTGCTPNPWTLTDPAGARSFAIDITADVEAFLPGTGHGDLLRITLPVKDINEPTTAADLNKVAWNSFAYTVTDTDGYEFLSAEPIKVGVTMSTDPPVTASLGDVVWWDEDNDGVQDAEEEGINGVTVHLYNSAGELLQSTITENDPADPTRAGYYRFYGLDPTTPYDIKIDRPTDTAPGGALHGYTLSGTDQGGVDTLDNDAAIGADGWATITAATTGAANTHNPTNDFGWYKAPTYSLGNRVWFDENRDGLIGAGDPGAPGAPGVRVNLLHGDATPVLDGAGNPRFTTTDGSGYYRFDDLLGGGYVVELPASNFLTGAALQGRLPADGAGQNADPNSDIDSDDNGLDALVAGAIRTGVVTLGPVFKTEPGAEADVHWSGQGNADLRANMTVDLGVYTPRYAVGNFTWFDAGKDGAQAGDAPIGGVVVNLYRSDGVFVGQTTSATDGSYVFDNLLGGDYYAEFTPPFNHVLTAGLVGAVDSDSNPDPTTRRTSVFTLDQSLPAVDATDPAALVATRINRTIDAGVIPAFTIGNLVWDDFDDDGRADDGEAPIAGVAVELYLDTNADGAPDGPAIQSATTGADGKYLFTNLSVGSYIVRIPADQPTLDGLRGSGTPNQVADDQIDHDNNGVATTAAGVITGWQSGTLTIGGVGAEPTTETGGLEAGDPDEDANLASDDQGDWTIDFGFHRQMRIGNQIWLDGLAGETGYDNGIFDAGEVGIGGITVSLWTDDGDGVFDPAADILTDEAVTNSEGNYWFENVTPGSRTFVAVRTGPGGVSIASSTGASGNVNALDNDDDGDPAAGFMTVSALITVPTLGGAPTGESDTSPTGDGSAETEANALGNTYPDGNSDLLIDFGFKEIPLYRLGNLVWLDADKDGVAEVGEPGIDGVTVELYDSAGGFVASVNTTDGGGYVFDNLAAGQYEVRIPTAQTALRAHFSSPVDEVSADADGDSNDNGALATDYYTSGMVTLGDLDGSGDTANVEPTTESVRSDDAADDDLGTTVTGDNRGNLSVDFAFYHPLFSIGNQVWFDLDDDGTIEAGEGPVPNGVVVNLLDGSGAPMLDADGNPITTTTAGGNYLFAGLDVGTYIVEIAASNFATGGLLHGWRSSNPTSLENDIDGDDNGGLDAGGGLRSAPFVLAEGTEPAGESPDNDAATPDGNENLTVDFGIVPNFSLGNEVWFDLDDNGMLDVGEAYVPDGVVVNLLDADGTFVRSTTITVGMYLFDGLLAGSYMVEIPASQFADGAALSTTRSSTATATGDDLANDRHDHGDDLPGADGSSGGVRTGLIELSPLAEPSGENPDNDLVTRDGNENLTWDLGIVPLFALGNEVWFDLDDSGTREPGEPVVANGTVVNLYAAGGLTTVLRSTVVADGLYRFTGLLAGDYVVELASSNFAPGGVVGPARSSTPTSAPNGDADQTDDGSDATDSGGAFAVRTAPVTLGLGAEPLAENPDNDPTTPDANENLTVDLGIVPLFSIGNQVFIDDTDNGGFDAGESDAGPGVVVGLLHADGTPVLDSAGVARATTTDDDGRYLFTSLDPGDYIVQLAASNFVFGGPFAGYRSSTPTFPENDTDGDDNGGGPAGGAIDSGVFTLAFGDEPTGEVPDNDTVTPDVNENLTVDFGIFRPRMALGNHIWYDFDDDGILDATEPMLPDDTEIRLYDQAGGLVGTRTLVDGLYLFTGLIPGSYIVEITIPDGYRSSTPSTIVDTDGVDHGVDASLPDGTLVIRSATVILTEGLEPADEDPDNDPATLDLNSNLTIDLGVVPMFSLGNQVWFDLDGDGGLDAAEPGAPAGVVVNLLLADGSPVLDGAGNPVTTTTDAFGLYLFEELLTGSYIVELAASNFADGGLLAGWYSWPGQDGTDTDQTDHGGPAESGAIRTQPILLTLNAEPTEEEVDNDDVTPDRNENLTADFGLTQLALGNRLFFDSTLEDGRRGPGEAGAGNVPVELWASDGTGAIGAVPLATTTTNADGYYLFAGILPGQYVVRVPVAAFAPGGPLAGFISTEGNSTAPPAPDDDVDDDDNGTHDEVNGWVQTGPVSLAYGAEPIGETDVVPGSPQGILDANTNLTVDLGFVVAPPLSLGNRVWHDANNDGVINADEVGIAGVTVLLHLDSDGDGQPDPGASPLTALTDTAGYYLFTDLVPGRYLVGIPATEFAVGGPLHHWGGSDGSVAPDADFDSDDSGVGVGSSTQNVWAMPVTLSYYDEPIAEADLGSQADATADVNSNLTVDFGFFGLGSIGDRVWFDDDRDGVQGDDEGSVGGVTVRLFDASGNLIGTTMTGPDGRYLFDDLRPGGYRVEFDLSTTPYGFIPSVVGAGGDPAFDSDADPFTGSTGTWQIGPGTAIRDVDMGLSRPPLAVGDLVWFDLDHDGVQAPGENPVAGVTVTLLIADPAIPGAFVAATDAGGVPIAPFVTGTDGRYVFDDLLAGDYRVTFTTTPPGSRFTSPSTGAAGHDSNADTTGTTTTFTLHPRQPNVTAVEAGDQVTTAVMIDRTIDAGLWIALAIGDHVWHDADHNGRQDAGEAPVAGITATLLNADGTPALDADGRPVAPMATTADGTYVFDNLVPGDYRVQFSGLPTGWEFTRPLDPSIGVADDSNADRAGITPVFSLRPDGASVRPVTAGDGTTVATRIDPSIDAGIWQPLALGSRVWIDTDRDGRQDDGELGVSGVTVTITRPDGSPVLGADGTPVRPTISDANGNYLFDDLLPGEYVVIFTGTPTGTTFTGQSVGDAAGDSNVDATGRSGVITLTTTSPDIRPGAVSDGTTHIIDPTIDAGLIRPAPTGGGLPATGGDPRLLVLLGLLLAIAGALLGRVASRRRAPARS